MSFVRRVEVGHEGRHPDVASANAVACAVEIVFYASHGETKGGTTCPNQERPCLDKREVDRDLVPRTELRIQAERDFQGFLVLPLEICAPFCGDDLPMGCVQYLL